MPDFYSMINARFNERRTDANRGDILSSHDKNQIHVHNHARIQEGFVVSYKRKYAHELLVNCLFKPAQEKVWLGELTVPQ